jgi:RecB family exonuclease
LRGARELAALALAVSHADKIVLVHRTRAEDGSALAPAPLIAWLERAGAQTSHWHGSPLAGRPLSVADARLRALASHVAGRATLAPGATRRAGIELLRESFHGKARANNGIARERTTSREAKRIEEDDLIGWLQPGDEALSAALADETGGTDHPLPVTALERFAQCAFQGFATQVLRARDVERREDTPDAREEGTLIHDALAAAFLATGPLWRERPRDLDAIRTRALEAADLSLQRDRAASMLRRIALDQAREDVARVVEWSLADLEWDFDRAEQPFGDPKAENGWPALVLTDAGATLTLTGKIDRVDVGHDDPLRVRAIDYKRTATKVVQSQRELGTTALQVPLYAQVAGETMKRPDLSGLYLPSARLDPAYAPPPAFSARWRELFDRARESGVGGVSPLVLRAVGLVRSIRDGSLAPLPHDERACDYCRIDAGCRRPRFVVSDDDMPEGEPT